MGLGKYNDGVNPLVFHWFEDETSPGHFVLTKSEKDLRILITVESKLRTWKLKI